MWKAEAKEKIPRRNPFHKLLLSTFHKLLLGAFHKLLLVLPSPLLPSYVPFVPPSTVDKSVSSVPTLLSHAVVGGGGGGVCGCVWMGEIWSTYLMNGYIT